MADAPPRKPFSPFLFVMFGLVFLVLFSPGIRDMLGRGTGFVLDPIIGFSGDKPAVTLLLASALTGILTSVARHYMVDHVKLARVQETMRAFQKEFAKARKEQNTYKVKRMTELQPKLMQLQGEMTGSQMKPMVATMLVVIPVFAWLSTWIATPVAYEVEAPEDALVLAYDGGLIAAGVGPFDAEVGRDFALHAVPLGGDGAGTVAIVKTTNGARTEGAIPGDAELLDVARGAAINLTAGTWTVRAEVGDRDDPAPSVGVLRPGSDKVLRYREAILVVVTSDGHVAVPVTTAGATLRLDAPAVGHLLVPIRGPEPRGSVVVLFDGPLAHEVEARAVEHGFALGPPTVDAPPPHTMRLPWNPEWDLQASWKNFFPHWILVYSLFSIPLGQLVQKSLKGLQFSRELGTTTGA